jgi:hypothetical protein
LATLAQATKSTSRSAASTRKNIVRRKPPSRAKDDAGSTDTPTRSFVSGNDRASCPASTSMSARACSADTPGFSRPTERKKVAPRSRLSKIGSTLLCIATGTHTSGTSGVTP